MQKMHFSIPNHTFVIFREWKVTSIRDIGGSFVAVLALAVLYECVKGIHIKSRQKNWELSEKTFNIIVKKLNLITQIAKTCLFVAELSFAYFLMLIAMTYNTWLFVAVVIGRGMGYYVVTPLIETYYRREETADYSDIQRDYLSLRRKRYPLIQGADI
ncbi:probable low affinity copper uptake protein 2 [Orbicella faveolata]|uniref:probable low affinity copper uptake protein 2 n=1 Tax=Orbicella faveolata TaxID=48498 RepID=UPI0009E19CF7|nr:probable low affinity copper uptake protein 2 [Orbicella faveolata]